MGEKYFFLKVAKSEKEFTFSIQLFVKSELLQEGIFFPHPFICQRRFRSEKVDLQLFY